MIPRLVVFARAPVAGRCKTRLIPRLGPRGAARVQSRMLRHALQVAVDSGLDTELWCAPDTRHPLLRRRARACGARLRRQSRGDLGQRMAWALRNVRPTIVIGTDCPALRVKDVLAAAAALQNGADAVLQPATDGGYVLIAARCVTPRMLSGIAWSSGREAAQTLSRLRRFGRRVRLLPALPDVDTPRDYVAARRRGELPFLCAAAAPD